MARHIEGEFERRYVAEKDRLNGIHQESVKDFGLNLGSVFFEYAYGRDITGNRLYSEKEVERNWSGKRMEFARTVVETMEIGTKEEKVQALTAVLKSFEVQIGIETRKLSPAVM